ncbi:hypothetical protein BX616_008484 [Lobosporangium transversale]|nr:hypothetical protein BX616_008484 [Lobosporangium transversale]
MYRFTHRMIEVIQDDNAQDNKTVVPAEVTLANLTMFSTVLFMTEFHKMGMGDSVDISKTCNMSEWHRRLYAGTRKQASNTSREDEDEYIDILTLLPKPIPEAGVIYATTSKSPNDASDKEKFTSFLFAHHKQSIAQTIPSLPSQGASIDKLSPETQALISKLGVTHIWLCGSDPEQRRHGLMVQCLNQLEKDVYTWKSSGQASGIITVHTIPQAFPGMVHFLTKNEFQGGDKVVGGDAGKVLFWKEV